MDLNKGYISKKIVLNGLDNSKNVLDKYINVFLTKTGEIYEYVDVKKDTSTHII